MAIDLTDRIIQGKAVRPLRLHPMRRAIQVLLGVFIVLCPPLNWLRIDLRAADFWVAGHRYSSQHVVLFFWSAALLAMVLFTVSLLYGRWWCGWVCPQTLASDFGDSMKDRLVRLLRAKPSPARMKVATALWAMLMLAAAVVTAELLGSYFIAPNVMWATLVNPAANPGVAMGTWIAAALMAGNLLALRRKFCASACPYGLFLSIAGDTNTMTVRYLTERADDCIQCGKCVTVCPLSIDIRKGVNQPECIGCGECVDACNDILPRLKSPKAGLIEYRYGEGSDRATRSLSFARRFGLWDAKRLLLIAATVALGGGLAFAALLPTPTTISVSPSGNIARDGANVVETYDVGIENGQPGDTRESLSVNDDANVRLVEPRGEITAEGKALTGVRLVLERNVTGLAPGTRIPLTVAVRQLDGGGNARTSSARIILYVPTRGE